LYISKINISLRKTILDPQGKAIEHSLKSLGFEPIIDAGSKQEAEQISEEACKKLLANPVMEDFTFEVTESGGNQ